MITAITTALSSVDSATKIIQGLKETKSFIDNSLVNVKIAELMNAVANTKIDLAEIKYQLVEKENLIKELTKQLETKGKVFYKDSSPFIWMKDNNDIDIPFCQKCYVKNKDIVKVSDDSPMLNKGTHQCPVCDTWYGKKIDPQLELNKAVEMVWGK